METIPKEHEYRLIDAMCILSKEHFLQNNFEKSDYFMNKVKELFLLSDRELFLLSNHNNPFQRFQCFISIVEVKLLTNVVEAKQLLVELTEFKQTQIDQYLESFENIFWMDELLQRFFALSQNKNLSV